MLHLCFEFDAVCLGTQMASVLHSGTFLLLLLLSQFICSH